MDDSKLLELAGLAAGETYSQERNPLERDDLALRLAVKVGQLYMIRIEIGRSRVEVNFDAHIAEAFLLGDDIAACARRAIVRAAAEIGRQR